MSSTLDGETGSSFEYIMAIGNAGGRTSPQYSYMVWRAVSYPALECI